MEYKWKISKLKDLGDIVGGGTPPTKNDSYYGGDISWITPKDLSNYRSKYIYKGERNITEEGLNNSSAKLLPKGTVLFSSRAPIGYIAIAGNKVSTNQGFKSIVPNDRTTSDFLYYLLIYNLENIKNQGSGSTFNEVSGTVMKNIEVLLPPLYIQKKISTVLSSLDQKIETNNKIIANLESQAQAIFKSWFVDFEPFQDGEFVESELGMIPKGWKICKLSDIAVFSNGYGFKSNQLNEKKENFYDYKVFKMADIKVGGGLNPNRTKSWVSKDFVISKNLDRFIIKSGDLLMCMTDMKDNVRLLGNTALIMKSNEYILNQRVGRIRSKLELFSPAFLYFLTNSNGFLEDLRGRANRGVQVNLSTYEIMNSKIILPDKDYLMRFNKLSTGIVNTIANLQIQNHKLAQIRDTLLPKLMSGEIDVSNIKIDIEEDNND